MSLHAWTFAVAVIVILGTIAAALVVAPHDAGCRCEGER